MQDLQCCSVNCVFLVTEFLICRDIHAWLLTCTWFRKIVTNQYRQKKSWPIIVVSFWNNDNLLTLRDYAHSLEIGDWFCPVNLDSVHTLTFFAINHSKNIHRLAAFFPPSLQSLTLEKCSDVSLNKLFTDSPNDVRYSALMYLKLSTMTCLTPEGKGLLPSSLTTIKLIDSVVRIDKWPSSLTSLTEKSPRFYSCYSKILPPPSLRKWKTYDLADRAKAMNCIAQSDLFPNLTYLKIYKTYAFSDLLFIPLSRLTTLKLPHDVSTDDCTMFANNQRSLHTLDIPAYTFQFFNYLDLFAHLTVLTLREIKIAKPWKGVIAQCKNLRSLTLISDFDIDLDSFLGDCTSITHLQILTPSSLFLARLPYRLQHLYSTCLRMQTTKNFPRSIRSISTPNLHFPFGGSFFCTFLLSSLFLNRLVIAPSLRASCKYFLCNKNTSMRWMVYKRADGTIFAMFNLPMTQDEYDSHMMQFPDPPSATSKMPFKTCILVNEHATVF